MISSKSLQAYPECKTKLVLPTCSPINFRLTASLLALGLLALIVNIIHVIALNVILYGGCKKIFTIKLNLKEHFLEMIKVFYNKNKNLELSSF